MNDPALDRLVSLAREIIREHGWHPAYAVDVAAQRLRAAPCLVRKAYSIVTRKVAA